MSGGADPVDWYGVIDIGSNSVRLVIYDVAGRAMLPHYNEKVMAKLGAGLANTQCLSEQGIKVALKALRRYKAILDGLGVPHVRVVATAAVRLAKDGADFVARVNKETGLKVEVISGREEARLSALGVSCGVHMANGLVGDLGGSSLEFCRLENGKVKDGETLMLGPLSMEVGKHGAKGLAKKVRVALRKSDLLPKSGGRFYMVGGAWRALAKLHMDLSDYPLKQLHSYLLDAHAIQAIDEAAQREDPVGRQLLIQASQRRVDILPYASLVLKEIFDIGAFSDAMVSSYGLREGTILDGLGKGKTSKTALDPLLEGVALSARLPDQARGFGQALFKWIGPVIDPLPDLFGERDLDMRLVEAACLLADIGARFHPDTRAKLAYNQTLNGPYSNATHAERAFIALAVGCRYSRHFQPSKRNDALLDKRQAKLARRLGAAMRLGAVYSGRSTTILEQSKLERGDQGVILSVPKAQKALVSATVERRLRTLAGVMDLEAHVQNV